MLEHHVVPVARVEARRGAARVLHGAGPRVRDRLLELEQRLARRGQGVLIRRASRGPVGDGLGGDLGGGTLKLPVKLRRAGRLSTHVLAELLQQALHDAFQILLLAPPPRGHPKSRTPLQHLRHLHAEGFARVVWEHTAIGRVAWVSWLTSSGETGSSCSNSGGRLITLVRSIDFMPWPFLCDLGAGLCSDGEVADERDPPYDRLLPAVLRGGRPAPAWPSNLRRHITAGVPVGGQDGVCVTVGRIRQLGRVRTRSTPARMRRPEAAAGSSDRE